MGIRAKTERQLWAYEYLFSREQLDLRQYDVLELASDFERDALRFRLMRTGYKVDLLITLDRLIWGLQRMRKQIVEQS